MKMKRTVIFITALMIFSGLMLAQTITVTSPAAGANWCRGNTYEIRWTKTGTQDDQVKIRLFDSTGTSKILDITNDTANDGSFNWPIPTSVAVGRYVIRVKTLDNLVTDDSDVFNIIVCDRDSATITVTQPSAGVNWQVGTTKAIRWDKTGTQDTRVKIRLFDSTGTNKILDITNDTPNDGGFDWPIPSTCATGRYLVRVKTLDNNVFDDSAVFNLTPFMEFHFEGLRPVVDLQLKSVYFTDAAGGKIVARIKNGPNRFEGDVKVMYKILPSGSPRTVTKRVNAAGGAEKVIALFSKTRAEMGCSGISLQVKLDPDNDIAENNEDNNELWKTVYATSEQDGKIVYVKVKVGGTYVEVPNGGTIDIPGSGTANTVNLMIRVINCGGTRFEGKTLEIKQDFKSTLREPRGHCRNEFSLVGTQTGISLSAGIARSYIIPVTLIMDSGSKCRTDKNEIIVNFICDDSSGRLRNNVWRFNIR